MIKCLLFSESGFDGVLEPARRSNACFRRILLKNSVRRWANADSLVLLARETIGYCHGIRSERRLCEEVGLNLAYRWFCRLGIEDGVPDHSTFSKTRHGRLRDADILRHVFETTVKTRMDKGLVGGEGFATDASIIRADANRQNHIDGGDDHDWTGGPAAAARAAQCASVSKASTGKPRRRRKFRFPIRLHA